MIVLLLIVIASPAAAAAASAATAPERTEARWLPAQAAPKVVVRARPPADAAEEMLQQSLVGLLAQSVNERRGQEMLWLDAGCRPGYALWYPGMLKRLGAREDGPLATLDLVKRYAGSGIIKGYILYRMSAPFGNGLTKAERNKADGLADQSVNVATTLAGILGGVIVSEELEPAIKALGLARVADARDKTPAWCFSQYRGQLNRAIAQSQRPRLATMRDIAIAHRMFVFWGDAELTTSLYTWLDPLSTIVGWVGNEGDDVAAASRYGHVVIPSDHCLNITMLSAGVSARAPVPRLKSFDPRTIDPDDTRTAVAFVLSDGDNLQWTMGGFFQHSNYWASPEHGSFPIGFGLPCHNLADVCPDAIVYAAGTQPDRTSVIEASGYIFPDTFGSALGLERRRELLRQHARRLGRSIGLATGVASLVFICRDVDAPAAIEAYEIYAREIDGLAGMFAVQYAPYEAGDGRVFWLKGRAGDEVPLVTSKYSLWANNKNPRAGNPDRIADRINAFARAARAKGEAANLWVMTHAWSAFERDAAGSVTDLPFGSGVGSRGVAPTAWCAEQLDREHVIVVSPVELLWRLRVQRSHAREVHE